MTERKYEYTSGRNSASSPFMAMMALNGNVIFIYVAWLCPAALPTGQDAVSLHMSVWPYSLPLTTSFHVLELC